MWTRCPKEVGNGDGANSGRVVLMTRAVVYGRELDSCVAARLVEKVAGWLGLRHKRGYGDAVGVQKMMRCPVLGEEGHP